MIVTIDGPAGAGKSTLAKLLAERIGFEVLDTGAMYRAVTLTVLRFLIDPEDTQSLTSQLRQIELEVMENAVRLNGEDITSEIRSPEVTNYVRHVADKGPVRRFLTRQQREFAADRNVVTEGRDQGTIVFPDADCKIFLTASPETRARRRFEELVATGHEVEFQQVLDDQIERDKRDEQRTLAPLKPAEDAIVIDCSELDVDQVLDLLEKTVRQRLPI